MQQALRFSSSSSLACRPFEGIAVLPKQRDTFCICSRQPKNTLAAATAASVAAIPAACSSLSSRADGACFGNDRCCAWTPPRTCGGISKIRGVAERVTRATTDAESERQGYGGSIWCHGGMVIPPQGLLVVSLTLGQRLCGQRVLQDRFSGAPLPRPLPLCEASESRHETVTSDLAAVPGSLRMHLRPILVPAAATLARALRVQGFALTSASRGQGARQVLWSGGFGLDSESRALHSR